MLGHNMFAYCRNNPVKRRDASGFSDKTDIDGDGDIYELETYGGGGNGGYAYGTGTRGYTTSSYATDTPYYSTNFSSTHSTTSGSTASGSVGGFGGYGTYYGGNNIRSSSNRFSGNQQALLEIVRQGAKSGFSMNDAKILYSWGQEYGFKNLRIDTGHSNGTNDITRGPHLHLGPYNHIRILGTK